MLIIDYAWEALNKGTTHKRIATIREAWLNECLSNIYGFHTDTPTYQIDSRFGAFYLRYNWSLDAWQVGLDENFLK